MEQKKKNPQNQEQTGAVVRIFGQDIPTNKNIYVGLREIKGISWSLSNVICHKLGIDKKTKIGELSKETISKIDKSLNQIDIPDYLKNRRKDPESGTNRHLFTNDLDIRKELDIKRLKKIKSYRGIRHSLGLPSRGQRTRSHFKKKRVVVGVKKKKE